MQHSEMVRLLRDGVPATAAVWADIGAGSGNFTAALHDLLPPTAVIYAVDRDAWAVAAQNDRWAGQSSGPAVIPSMMDITKDLGLPPLDGILLANVLHFIRNQTAALRHLVTYLRPGGRLLLVEYDLSAARSYVPFPISISHVSALAQSAGLPAPRILSTRRSPSSGTVMYSAVVILGEVREDLVQRQRIE